MRLLRVLITGATGYLGQAVTRYLVEQGEEVVALVRPQSRSIGMRGSVRLVPGDILNRESLEAAMEGCSSVIHLAGVVKMWLRDPRQFHRVNVDGFRQVLEVAERHRVNRFLYASSFVALGPTGGRVVDESHPHPGDRFRTEYERTKFQADRVAVDRSRGGYPLVILYPTVLYGPGPATEGNLMLRVLVDCLREAFPGYLGKGDRQIGYAYIGDVARGFHLALRKGGRGERYLLGGENVTFVEFLDLLEEVAGISIRRRKIPFWMAELAGRLQRVRARLLGIPPNLTDGVVRVYRHDWAYSSRKAEEELGYRITPLRDGLRETVKWLRSAGGLNG